MSVILWGLGLTGDFATGENGWQSSMNNNLRKLSTLAQPVVKSKDLTTPPVSPVRGDAYIVAPSAVDAWFEHDKQIAVWDGDNWVFYVPSRGWHVYVESENTNYQFNGTSWEYFAGSGSSAGSLSDSLKMAILQINYPVGTPYFNKTDHRNPNEIFGVEVGVWVRDSGRFLVGQQDDDPDFGVAGTGAEAYGGKKGHKMTIANLIEHDHDRNPDGHNELVHCDENVATGVMMNTSAHAKIYNKTGKTGGSDPEPIPTLPPFAVYHWWVRTS